MKRVSFIPTFLQAARTTGLRAWQTGRLFQRAVRTALDSVQEVLRAEVQKGNGQLVADFLTNKALPAARALLLERMASRLLIRLGLRGVLASSVVGWVLPFVVEHLVKVGHRTGLFEKIRENSTVTDTLRRLEELKQATWKALAPDHGTGAEVLPDDAEPPRQLPA
ncbi:hypothetical protein HMJ29_18300 [Hymenobacter taeanensis]|uniref:Uncharacterized protein n=1 Tax=Hymenobacter taeanensis TaxID=2735321 RepID=A0A6M6BJL5_9BACT|nr:MULTISPECIES: hypothetical protein [Hymenobacter]QJX48761.1 hypothetical protein HMJ29_18300 [Hymenobacter taeanensis]UOQ81734.1 hypothetical protein MUN83_02775 [Hymenobacter sp. 5414T-23]